jgi:uncharacterized protein (DUF1684 family)
MGKPGRITCLVAVALALAACDRGEDEAAARAAADARAKAFAAHEAPWRAERRASLLAPDGWTSLIGLHWIDRGAHYAGSAPGNGLKLAMGPAHLGMFDLAADGRVRFVPAQDATLTLDGQPLQGATLLKTDRDEGGPSKLGFDDGQGMATVIRRGDRTALRVKHAQAESRVRFAGLQWWPGGSEWVVPARFVAHPPGRTLPIVNIIGQVDEMPNPGVVEFQRGDKTYRIEAIDEGEPTLFLVYADRTSGHGSYPAGRYLDIPRPGKDGRVTVDFNRGYNPPCAFTAFATCPLPPAANRLDLAIVAGEKAYAKH